MGDSTTGSGTDYRPWTNADDGSVRLLGSIEKDTGRCFFPPLPATSPQAYRFETTPLAEEAVLYSHTTIYPSPKSGKSPFTLVYADFPERVRVFGRLRLAEGEQPHVGARLRVELESQPDGSMDYVFATRL
jgi:uncharacterized protein